MQGMRRIGLATGTLTDYEINYIETQLVKTVRPLLVGRTLMPTRQLGNPGYLKYTYYTENDMSAALIDMTGEEESIDLVDLTEGSVNVPVLHKEYRLHWRDVELRRQTGEDLNTQHAENAARQVAEEEDKLILTGEYTGWAAMGIQGLATATSRQTTAGGDWSANCLTYVATAKQLLRAAGYQGPYKLILRSTWYAQMEAPYSTGDRWYFQLMEDLLGGPQNIVVSDSLYTSTGATTNALLIDTQPQNFELIIGRDMTNHMVQMDNMNYYGKVYEVVVPVIKRPTAIVEITSLT